MGSTSSTPAALIKVWSLSDCVIVSETCQPQNFLRLPRSSWGFLFELGVSVRGGDEERLRRTHGDLDAIIGEDESRVGRGNFGVRHCD